MADISLTHDVFMDESDEGVFEQGDCSPGSPTEDDILPPLSLVQKYAQAGNPFDRQVVGRIVQELFRKTPAETLTAEIPNIMKIIKDLIEKDEPMVRAGLLEQIPLMASQALEYSNRVECLKTVVGEYLLPLVVCNLGCSDNAVDKAAHSTLIHLMEQRLITMPQAEIQVCPAILALSNQEQTADINTGAITVHAFAHQLDVKWNLTHITASFDERKSALSQQTASQLMSKMAPLLGRDVTERVFLRRFAQLCSSHMFYVRKVCASHIGDFCAVVGKNQYEKVLLPAYIEMCQDDIWGVRKSCAEVIMYVSAVCPLDIRRNQLAPVFAKLLQDECRWVRMSAFQTLGPFISTFADPPITNVAYNNQGDLVFVNNDGSEFLINSPSVPDVRFCKFLPKQSSLTDLVCSNQDFDLYLGFEDAELTLKKNKTGDVIKFKDVNDAENSEVKQSDDCFKEIVESVKNAVLSYRNVEEEHGVIGDNLKTNLSNANVISDIKNETCDNLDSTINQLNDELKNIEEPKPSISSVDSNSSNLNNSDLNRSGNNVDKSHQETNENIKNNQVNSESDKEDDNLDLYNSYNYWYISPEIPLDLSIIDEGQSSKNKLDGEDVAAQLEDLYSKIKLNDSTCESTDKLTVCDDEPVEKSDESLEPQQDIVPQVLINHFLLMTDSSFSINIDNEMSYHCAYSLPAVALTLRNKNWPLLQHTIERLAGDMQYKVRRTVASSLHELAWILGPEIATEHLTPIFEGFIKDLDEVRIGILKHLACFLKLIEPEKRLSYLPRLQDFLKTENESNWRFRHELATQLQLIIKFFKPVDSAKHIGLIAESLLHDVSAVKEAAISLITELLAYISVKPGLNTLYLVRLVEKFAHSKKWKLRQTFALLCWKLLSCEALPPEQFALEIMPHLLDLSWDPVANVRLVVAKTIAQHIISNQYFADPNNEHFDSLGTVIRRLQADKDRDVRQYAELGNGLPSTPPLLTNSVK